MNLGEYEDILHMEYKLKLKDHTGRLLEVLQELPDKGDKFATILMVPGFGANLHEYGYFDDVSRVLVKNGFQTFRFSFAGTGLSEGEFLSMTLTDQAKQLLPILDYVKKDRFTNKRKIGIFAHSFGTSTVVASLPLLGIKTYLFTGSNSNPQESLQKLFSRERGFDPEGISKRIRSDKSLVKIGPEIWKDLNRYNLVTKIKELTGSILFIHGEKDRHVYASESLAYYEAVDATKRFLLVEVSDHAFTGKFRTKALELIADWFNEQLH